MYLTLNLLETEQLLDACARVEERRVAFASSSSVYGNAAAYPTAEATATAPESPYGVTKRAGEDLMSLLAGSGTFDGLHSAISRFTVPDSGQT